MAASIVLAQDRYPESVDGRYPQGPELEWHQPVAEDVHGQHLQTCPPLRNARQLPVTPSGKTSGIDKRQRLAAQNFVSQKCARVGGKSWRAEE